MTNSRPAKRARTVAVDLTNDRAHAPLPLSPSEVLGAANDTNSTTMKLNAEARKRLDELSPAEVRVLLIDASKRYPELQLGVKNMLLGVAEWNPGLAKEIGDFDIRKLQARITQTKEQPGKPKEQTQPTTKLAERTQSRRVFAERTQSTPVFADGPQRTKNQVHTFDYASKSVWRTINRNAHGNGSRQFHAAAEVVSDIEDIISAIVKKATPRAKTHPDTVKNAMEALRKVGKTICLSEGSTLTQEVHRSLRSAEYLVAGMVDIWNEMTEEELAELWNSHNEKGEQFGDKLTELGELARAMDIFDGLERVIEAFEDTLYNISGDKL